MDNIATPVQHDGHAVKFIDSEYGLIERFCEHVESSSLLRRSVRLLEETAEPISDMLCDGSFCYDSVVLVRTLVDTRLKRGLSGLLLRATDILKSLAIAGINVVVGGSSPLMFIAFSIKPCVDALIYILSQRHDGIYTTLNRNATTVNVCTTLFSCVINTAIGSATETLSEIKAIIFKQYAFSIWNELEKQHSTFTRLGGYFVLNSILFSGIGQPLIKTFAKIIKESCRVLISPTVHANENKMTCIGYADHAKMG